MNNQRITIDFKNFKYTCENGALISFNIPDTATEDDLKGFREMVDVVLKRTYKLKEVEE